MNLEKIVHELIQKNLILYIILYYYIILYRNICNEENRFFEPKGNA